MGTHRSYRVYANVTPEVENQITNFLNEDKIIWKRFSPPSKWYAEEIIRKLSCKFASVVFMREVVTEEYEGMYERSFYLNGTCLTESVVFPKPHIPSVTQFKSKLIKFSAKKKKENTRRLKLQAQEEKKKKQARIKSLKSELQELEGEQDRRTDFVKEKEVEKGVAL